MNYVLNHFRKYYGHIDGLRAISVLSVLFFHCEFTRFSGGFVGVDIFFVISGFLISKIIIEEISRTNHFNFINFYARRIKRIFPSLFVVLGVCFFLSIYLLNTAKFLVLGRALVAAALSFSNVFFYKQAGYFDQFSQSSPLLHTWSLAIEEQFYIFWPIIILMLFKKYKHRGVFLMMLTTFFISFILNLLYQKHSTAIFYLPQFRAFEFCTGAVLVYFYDKPLPNLLKELLCILGLVLVGYAIFFFNEKMVFPSYNALIPAVTAIKLRNYCLKNNLFDSSNEII